MLITDILLCWGSGEGKGGGDSEGWGGAGEICILFPVAISVVSHMIKPASIKTTYHRIGVSVRYWPLCGFHQLRFQ